MSNSWLCIDIACECSSIGRHITSYRHCVSLFVGHDGARPIAVSLPVEAHTVFACTLPADETATPQEPGLCFRFHTLVQPCCISMGSKA
jgi:hypothetical protein